MNPQQIDASKISYAFGLPPRDAAAYLESLGCVPTEAWSELLENARAGAFTIARMTEMELLTEVRGLLDMAMQNGLTMKEFVKTLAPELERRGWTGKREKIDPKTGQIVEIGQTVPSRMKLVFFQNMQSAYMAGRYRAQLANCGARPWWMYSAVLDAVTRPSHAALSGRVFRYDDPFWQKFYPPNGFYCRCAVRALDDADLEKLGKTPESSEGRIVSQEVLINPTLPESERKIVGQWGFKDEAGNVHYISPGFAWNPGYGTWGIDHVLAQKLDGLKSDRLYAEVVQAINNSPARQLAFGLWIKRMLKKKHAGGDASVVGIIQPEVVAKAIAEGKEPARIAIMLDHRVKHADRELHHRLGTALSEDQYMDLAKNFANPEAIYWDKDFDNPIYIFPDKNPEKCIMLALNMPYIDKNGRKIGKFDGVATVYIKNRKDLLVKNLERIK